ncbi:MAG: hypothetical protein N4J56_000907 [Chroococcidiopsis sp. SAG 2025]|uniref:sodium:solute symporter family transporter n=1 Tax=Chroococcidiopsis sp. SAG 2025 TaxID=171389 RepID=UPI002936E66B|nr:hypothetical protein [Chroococcidiopsis sp. SAG 2025]MDV2991253.1 hypothetical protein [Chroococcidiopsis sp. SAG 2025]
MLSWTLWLILLGYGVLMWWIAPTTKTFPSFFQGKDRTGKNPEVAILTASIVVSWIFAKSITNAANLGRSYGLMGGLAYAGYYIGIPICGILIIRLRRMTGSRSLAEYVSKTYGNAAVKFFMAIVLLRLYNEVWSNTAVVGSYFGQPESYSFILSAIAFTVLVLIYSLKGGLRASLVTDFIQFGLLVFAVLLTLLWVVPQAPALSITPQESGFWNSGVDLLLVALIQCIPYTFHDPVLTDRAFLAGAKTTYRAYLLAGIIASSLIILFSFVGMAARVIGGDAAVDAPVQAAAAGGTGILALMLSVMMLSGGSTLDSTFSSTSKAVAIDLKVGSQPILLGKISMVAMAIVGNLPMLFGTNILKATTVSGTMVLGLAPIFLLISRHKLPQAAFFAPVGISVILGIVSALNPALLPWQIGSGENASLLAWNLVTFILVWIVFGYFYWQGKFKVDNSSK